MITYISSLKRKGNLKYEYNPFHNYLTNVNLYKDNVTGEIFDADKISDHSSYTLYATAGSIVDFDTDKLNFDLEHPVDITVQPSYDGSVNLILNDGKNIPRLINSRFSVRQKNTYEIVDRIGEYDTNIYNDDNFSKDSSLYFQIEKNPTVEYSGFIKGVFPVGLYCFYFTYCDADDNESDIIAESGLVPLFIGTDSDPVSMDGGIKNQLSDKGVILKLKNLDTSYNFIKVYYIRYFADYLQNRVYEAKKIYLKYPLYDLKVCHLQITGNELAEDIDPNILNITRFNPKGVLAQAQCKNMLFFGNIVKNTDNYKELTDCALRICPELVTEILNDVDVSYSKDEGEGYYSSLNMYNKVGYYPGEFYRFGVVFIYLNGTLSNTYNILGGILPSSGKLVSTYGEFEDIKNSNNNRNYIPFDNYGWVSGLTGSNLNAKGVVLIPENYTKDTIFGIKFNIPSEVIKYLRKELGIRGLFFVRQKRIPNILALCFLMPMDEVLKAPVLETKYADNYSKHRTELFINKENILTLSYVDRLHTYGEVNKKNAISNVAYAAICPDFLLNLPYYNQIFNGSKFKIKPVLEYKINNVGKYERIYAPTVFNNVSNSGESTVNICSVTEDVPTVAIHDLTYKLNIGYAEEAYRFGHAEYEGDDSYPVRGIYSPYLAMYSDGALETGQLYNIYSSNYQGTKQEFLNRMDSYEPFYAISDRYNFSNLEGNNDKLLTCWRGDCYLNTFTYRLNRNFCDSSLPNNDEIIQEKTWKEHYVDSKSDSTQWPKISRSDVNAVKLGSWITIKVRSPYNFALRSVDHSYVSEEAIMGTPRSFFPKSNLLEKGENKIPDSYLYNDAYRATLGFKCYFAYQDVNYIKDTFSNRIQYSAISIQDSYKNNYRESLSTYFRDYSQEYGSIQKLVGFEGYLLVVFEHAICIAVINERILAGQSDGEPVFINTKNVLPEELTVISDTYGTLWPESVIKSEAGYVYGVDTIQKKIWRVKSLQLEILSDFKVNEFLVNNLTLGEMEKTPIIGLRNVKTHYNNNKKDIMFTFYDDVYKDEEKAWNLCFNELLDAFVTFYSWIPSYSENIDTQFFSFDRNTSKCLSLLDKCKDDGINGVNKGVLVNNPILSLINNTFVFSYKPDNIKLVYSTDNQDKIIDEKYVEDIEKVQCTGFIIESDHYGVHKYVKQLSGTNNWYFSYNNNDTTLIDLLEKNHILLLEVTPYYQYDINSPIIRYPTETIALTLKDYLYGNESKEIKPFTTDFYLHGNAGIFDCQGELYPTHWYGEFHPFEFEFVVNDKVALLKIFTNLVIISNKAEPESFHFEIEGDNYEFSNDKRVMYFRLEATKNLYQNLGSDILYNRKFTDIAADKYTNELYYRGNPKRRNYSQISLDKENEYLNQYGKFDRVYPIDSLGLVQQVKSTIFPLYYERIDTYNDIYHIYRGILDDTDNSGYDFKNLSGSEIVWHRRLNLFNIVTHIKNSPIDKVGRMRGNSRYKEGKWNILIPSISFMLKNEETWTDSSYPTDGYSPTSFYNYKIPPIVVNSSLIPSDVSSLNVLKTDLPNIYINNTYNLQWPRAIDNAINWTARKETKIRDKWMKVRVRYSGKNLAVIHSLVTLYNISYS